MKQPAFIQIDIPNPCSQNWDDMTPVGEGRHCDSCRTTVIDFTTWSDAALYGFFSKQKEHVCGRYLVTQVGRPIHIPPQPHSRLYKLTVALGLTLLFTQTSGLHAQTRPPKVDTTIFSRNYTRDTGLSYIGVRGTILDHKKEPLINAAVAVYQKGVLKGATVTDFDGKYLIKPLEKGTYDIVVTYQGYKPVRQNNIILNEGACAVLDFAMDEMKGMYEQPIILGGKMFVKRGRVK